MSSIFKSGISGDPMNNTGQWTNAIRLNALMFLACKVNPIDRQCPYILPRHICLRRLDYWRVELFNRIKEHLKISIQRCYKELFYFIYVYYKLFNIHLHTIISTIFRFYHNGMLTVCMHDNILIVNAAAARSTCTKTSVLRNHEGFTLSSLTFHLCLVDILIYIM